MAYANRTCVECGYKSIQPNMRQVEIEYESGSSQAGISKRSVGTAMLFGSKEAQRQNTNWLTGNTKRKYMRKRKVWVCGSNVGCNKSSSNGSSLVGKFFAGVFQLFLMAALLFIAVLIFA